MTPAASTAPAYSGQSRNQVDRATETLTTILSVADVAEIFHCGREKIKRMARRGELPAFKFGKHWYIRKDDLERYLSGRVELSSHPRRIQEV